MSFSSVNVGEQLAIATKKQPVMSQQAQQRAVSKLPVFRQEGFLASVSKLPAAVQRDIEAEGVTFIYNDSELEINEFGGLYQSGSNVIVLFGNSNRDIHTLWGSITLAHEIGHSLQFVKDEHGVPKAYKIHELQEVFDKEVSVFRQKYPNQAEIYAMTNPYEMFAEIYAMLNSDIDDTSWGMYSPLMQRYQILKENFPKCIEVVKRHIEEIRALDESKRCNKAEEHNVIYDSKGRVVTSNTGGHNSSYTYDPFFPEIVRTVNFSSPQTNPVEVQYFHDRIIKTESCLYNGKLEKIEEILSKKDGTIQQARYSNNQLLSRSFEDKKNGNYIICFPVDGGFLVSICINGKQVVTGEKLDVSKEDFLSGKIDLKKYLDEYIESQKAQSKDDGIGWLGRLVDWFCG